MRPSKATLRSAHVYWSGLVARSITLDRQFCAANHREQLFVHTRYREPFAVAVVFQLRQASTIYWRKQMKTTSLRSAVAFAFGTLIVSATSAAPIKTLFLGADYMDDKVLSDIIGNDPRFDASNSAIMAAWLQTPTLSYLKQFDSVLYWSNLYPTHATALGDLLADYVDAGGLVVRATYVGEEVPNVGRIGSSGYAPFTTGVPDYDSLGACLGAYDTASPIMAGVTSLCARAAYGDWNNGLDTGATLIASWSDGKPLVGVNAKHNVVDISLYPNVAQYIFDLSKFPPLVPPPHVTGDYRQLFANSLAYGRGNEGEVPEPTDAALIGLGALAMAAVLRRRGSTYTR